MTDDMRACERRSYEITQDELPLSCPQKDQRLWDAHPKVYLPIEVSGEVVCPYCEAHYRLTDFQPPVKQ